MVKSILEPKSISNEKNPETVTPGLAFFPAYDESKEVEPNLVWITVGQPGKPEVNVPKANQPIADKESTSCCGGLAKRLKK